MEKLDYLCFEAAAPIADHRARLLDDIAPALVAAGAQQVVVRVADTAAEVPNPPLVLGRGPALSSVVTFWLDSLDDRHPLEALLADGVGDLDGYLVTESVPQRRAAQPWAPGTPSPGITHFTWFAQPSRLADDDFFRGWHEIHTPSSFDLHPRRTSYVRDTVARPITPGATPVRAIVFETFDEVADYADPDRLYSGPEALNRTMEELPLYADFADLNSCPLHEVIVTP